MAKTKTSNHTKPTKRQVRLTGKAVARSRATGTITVTRRKTRLTGRASAKSRASGVLTVTTRGERAASRLQCPPCHSERSKAQSRNLAEQQTDQSTMRNSPTPQPRFFAHAQNDSGGAPHSRPRACRGDNNDTKHRVITLTQGKFAVVDAEDYERLSKHKWYAAKIGGQFYAKRAENGRTITMHREIMNPPPGMVCDHKNHDTLDNRKSNLRICTPAQNAYNQLPQSGGTSRYKGVRWHKDNCKWEATIGHNGRNIHIGYYDYEADAAIAYDDMAIDLFGEFACLNFDHRPEIKLWIEATYLFDPTRNELQSDDQLVGSAACHCEEQGDEAISGYPKE